MRDRSLESAAFDPTSLGEMGHAFESAWSEIRHHFGETDIELARARLAKAVLTVAVDHDSKDVAGLKTEALSVLALTYRSRWPLNWQ